MLEQLELVVCIILIENAWPITYYMCKIHSRKLDVLTLLSSCRVVSSTRIMNTFIICQSSFFPCRNYTSPSVPFLFSLPSLGNHRLVSGYTLAYINVRCDINIVISCLLIFKTSLFIQCKNFESYSLYCYCSYCAAYNSRLIAFYCWSVACWMDIPQLVYPLTCWWAFGLFPVWVLQM